MPPAAESAVGRRSAALAVALALLLVLTLLAVVSVRGTRREAGPAAAEAATRLAFEAAERALDAGLARAALAPGAVAEGGPAAAPDGARGAFRTVALARPLATDVPEGFSVGSDSVFRARPVEVEATGTFKDRRVRLALRASLIEVDEERTSPELPPPRATTRPGAVPLYTDLALGALLADGNRVSEANGALTAERLGLAPGDAAGRARLLRIAQAATEGATTEPRAKDPLEPERAALTIQERGGGAILLVATSDGRLCALDAADGGRVFWSFAPLARIGRAGSLRASAAPRRGSLARLVVPPADASGVPRQIIVFAGGAGSSDYFAFDASDPRAPVLLWRAGIGQLPGAGERRAPPALGRIRIAGARQNAAAAVLIAAGGSDDGRPAAVARGNRLFILDLLSGALLWHAAPRAAAEAVDLRLARLDQPWASGVRALDLDGDGFLDRVYAVDLVGRVWRLDIHEGAAASALVTGTVIASLGAADAPGPRSEARRFYQAPDVAFMRDADGSFLELSLGSRGEGARNAFFALRDYGLAALAPREAGEDGWNPAQVLSIARLAPAGTAQVAGERPAGWYLVLPQGMSVTGRAHTYAGLVLFTAVGPPAAGSDARRRALYVLDARSGAAAAGRAGPALELPADVRSAPVTFGPAASGPASACGPGLWCLAPATCRVGAASCGVLPGLPLLPRVWRELDPGA